MSNTPKYECLERIGTGGMATVYRARQVGLCGFERIVALKRISPEHTADPAFVDWFVREAQIASALAHPGIVQVYDFGHDHEGYFIAMEHLEGRTLQQIVNDSRTVPIEVVLAIAQQLCDALDHVHRRVGWDGQTLGIVHRDISFANVFLTTSGHVKLIDFGVASARDVSPWVRAQVVGKLSYMAPEALRGKAIDARSDLFAVGVVLWQLLCGRPLFRGRDDAATVSQVLRAEIPPVSRLREDCPPQLDDLVMAMLERDPSRRPVSAAYVRERLDATMRGWIVDATPRAVARWMDESAEPSIVASALPTPLPQPLVDPPRRRGRSLAIRVCVAIMLIAPGGFLLHGRWREATAAQALPELAPAQVVRAAATSPDTSGGDRVPAVREVGPQIDRATRKPRKRQPAALDARLRPTTVELPEPIALPLTPRDPSAQNLPRLAIPELVAPPAPGKPLMIPPDRVRQIGGALGPVNVKRLERERVAALVNTLLCVDARGMVVSVKFLGRIPGWLQHELSVGLRTFRYTPYVADGSPAPACFVRHITTTH